MLRPCVPLTQAAVLDFRDLNSTLTKVVSGYKTCELQLTDKTCYITKITSKTRYITSLIVIFVFRVFDSLLASCPRYSTR
jgi:hypothetical protein